MEKLRPWCDQPSDRGRLKTRTDRLSYHTHQCHTYTVLSTPASTTV